MEDINVIYGEERIKRRGKYLVANIGSTLLIDVRDRERETERERGAGGKANKKTGLTEVI